MKIRPLADKVLVQRLEAETKTAGGIVLPDSAKEKPQRGKVIRVGEGKLLDDGTRGKMQIKKGLASDLPIESGIADFAISTYVWHELSDPKSAGVEMFRVLKPGGHIVVLDIRKSPGKNKKRHHESAHGPFDRTELANLLRELGFFEVKVNDSGHWLLAQGVKPSQSHL